MPKREDEQFIIEKEGLKRQPKCPHCGSTKVYHNRVFKSWKCTSCEHIFDTPEYTWGELTQVELEKRGIKY